MTQQITVDDFVNTLIAFGGPRPLKRSITLSPFGELDLGRMLDGHGTGKLYATRNAYVGQPISLSLVEETPYGYEPFADLTKSFPSAELEKGEVFVKTYAENDILRSGLLESGYFEDTGRRADLGFCHLEAWRLSPAFISAFLAANRKAVSAAQRALLPA